MEKMSNTQNHKLAADDSTKNSDTCDNFFEKKLITPDLKLPVVIGNRTEDCSSDTNLNNVDKEFQYGYKKVCNEKLDNNDSEKLDELFDMNKNDSNFTCNSLPVATNYSLNNEIHNDSDDCNKHCNSNNSNVICENVNSNNGIIKSALMNSALSSITTYGDTSSDDDCDDDAECNAMSQSQEPCNEDVNESDNVIIVDQLHDACLNTNNINDSQVDESVDFSRSETNHVVSSSSNNESTAFTVSQTVCSVEDDDDSSSSSSSSVLSNSSSSLVFFENSDFSDDNDENAYGENPVNESGLAKKNKKKPKKKSLMTKGELALEDLPPIEDLSISVPQDQCVLLGNILNIVDKLVVVQGLKDLPALDLDTVLFLECNKPLGQVFDVFGPVIEPLYCVRFNSNDHIREKEVAVGMPVYFVPKSNYTNYVFVAQLMKMKGSDASWEDNNEPPSEFLEYSDDEQERRAKKMLRKVAIKKEPKEDPDEPQKKRPPTAFERQMNERNLRMTEMQRRQSQNKKPWKQQNQLIRPPMFMAPAPSCDSNNSTIPQSSFDNHVALDFRSSFLRNSPSQSSFNPASDCKPPNFLSSFGYSKPASSFSSSVFSQCPPSPSPQSFSKAFNQNNLLISHASPPSPWITPPVSNSVNIPSSSTSFLSSDGFSSPFHVQHNRMATFCPPVNVPPPPLPQNVYSSTSNLTQNTQIVSSSFHPRSSNPVPCPPNIFASPPPPITHNNSFCSSFAPLSPPPRHHLSATFSSPPPPPHHHPTTFTSPPPSISFNNEINAFPPLHSSDIFCLPNTSSARTNQVDAVAFRPPPPLPGNGSPQLFRQTLQTFQNNFHRPSNPTPPNCRF